MNKTELKNFAVSARRDLLEKVALRAKIFGIDEKNGLILEEKFGQLAINGKTYSYDKKSAFLSLKKQIETKGYEQLIEETAYTWFNRIIAIRYMEVNDYLPERVNVLSSSTGKVEPDILFQFETMDLNIETVKIKELSRQGETEDAYKQLFIAECNALNKILPFMFEQIQDYTELLLPDYLLDSEFVVKKLVSNEALTESFAEVEVIGWLYQFYNSEPKDNVFANLKKNKKIEKYDIPAATQLFTPKWIVQYMVENSLGQLWLQSNPDSPLKELMRYYIEPAEQDEEVKQKLEEIRYKNVNLEEITIIDPCVGSGHILVYAFDLLYQMYEEAGYPSGDISQLILEKNLYGLDIDDRAAQLASFALMMKAREKSRRIFRQHVELNIYAIQESNHLDKEGIMQLLGNSEEEKEEIGSVIETFIDAKNFGSILQPLIIDYDKYFIKINNLGENQLTLETYQAFEQINEFKYLLKQAKVLASQFEVAVTNPPYMGNKGMSLNLSEYVKTYFAEAKTDMFSVFIVKCKKFTKQNGYYALITQPSLLFLSSFEKLRNEIASEQVISNLLHMGRGIFGIDFGSTAFVIQNSNVGNYNGSYFRLHEKTFQYIDPADIGKIFLNAKSNHDYIFNFSQYVVSEKMLDYLDISNAESRDKGLQIHFNNHQHNFKKIPGIPFAYWASKQVRDIFEQHIKLSDIADIKIGMRTGDNERFLRLWHEINIKKFGKNLPNALEAIKSNTKWVPYNKGGTFRKWYGNQDYVVNWENDGQEIKENTRKVYPQLGENLGWKISNESFYFKSCITWSALSSGSLAARYSPEGFIFDTKGSSMFFKNEIILKTVLGLLMTKVSKTFLSFISPTIDYGVGQLSKLPYLEFIEKDSSVIERINLLVENNISISKEDWNSFETSWDYKRSPILNYIGVGKLLSDAYINMGIQMETNYTKLKENEEELNRIFINLYGLQDELTSEVSNKEITIRQADLLRDTKAFLSYFIGNLMGRYSLNVDGIVFAGGEWEDSKYQKFKPNKFGLIQLTDVQYFEDDIIVCLRNFLSVTFGAETIEENLQWIAESLELKRNETAEERLRRYFLDEFFKDHCQVYQKRPIYWLVDSGKEKGLRTLIYIHRYQSDTMATIRFEHLQEIQTKYNNEIAAVDLRIVNPNLSATEKRDLEKRRAAYQKRLEELLEFDKKLAEYANAQIVIDLDDGVKVNYAKFENVLAKIK
ncbi:BREX-1 system adenine-specific DNA-methyltransferase PglX [Metabacillus idriensis]|uniref:BREX-1 system adenine-specific DNA-methyltransferase PglX n=1 Tax=Metabacillus idriensis TaxID=324768 RepID=UPI00203C0716|nr:BREX-1 system adenine-specific DNA-methyltransferase PglX [Metabacillus idriensis]MCM3595649.1 BREX-1 system adenine-specific DNA-methyltransferase PglX [Metabacillus idriensis]